MSNKKEKSVPARQRNSLRCGECELFSIGYEGATFGWCQRSGTSLRVDEETCIYETVMSARRERLIKWLISKLIGFNPFSELRAAAEFYANRQFYKHYPNRKRDEDRRGIRHAGCVSNEYLAYELSFMDGYIKCLHDHGLMFENGKIVKDMEQYS